MRTRRRTTTILSRQYISLFVSLGVVVLVYQSFESSSSETSSFSFSSFDQLVMSQRTTTTSENQGDDASRMTVPVIRTTSGISSESTINPSQRSSAQIGDTASSDTASSSTNNNANLNTMEANNNDALRTKNVLSEASIDEMSNTLPSTTHTEQVGSTEQMGSAKKDSAAPRSDVRTDVQNHHKCSSHWGRVYSRSQTNFTKESTYVYPPPIPPEPDRNESRQVKIAIRPVIGSHRCEQNAVIAFASGYELPQLIHFMTTLWRTGFDGDLVIGVADRISNETKDYFYQQSTIHPGLVVYETTLACGKMKYNQIPCQVVNLLEDADTGELIYQRQHRGAGSGDPRPSRRVSVVRYEYYWAWIAQYSETSQILVSDARDVYFQGNPFDVATQLYESQHTTLRRETTLFMFEEPSTIKQSNANSRWIKYTYPPDVYDRMQNLMVICSGITIGGQLAMETYARAMVDEFDRIKCTTCTRYHDQCLHNFLYYSDRLVGANGHSITDIIVHKQGEGGIVNTVGLVSKRNDRIPLRGLGLIHNETWEIFENDRTTVPAVIHMYDRDEEMRGHVKELIKEELSQWRRANLQNTTTTPTTLSV